MIKFILISNKQGLTRFSNYYNNCVEKEERSYFEADIVRKCLSRNEKQCSFIEYKSFKIVYRRYASLFFIVGIDESENELGIYELIHNLVEILDHYFSRVRELDIMFNLEKIHMIVDEMVCNGYIIETSKIRILQPIKYLDQLQAARIL